MKAHRTDLVSFAFGLTFLALALWWLLAQILGLTLPPVGWFLAGALLLIGVLGLVGALRSARDSGREADGRQPETTVAAPYLDGTPTTGGPAGPGADEWATDAVADEAVEAREDRPFDGEPRWSPYPPADGAEPGPSGPAEAGDRTGPATRELPAVAPTEGGPTTRELPVAEAPEGPAGGRRAGGDGPGETPG